eukprot:6589411-Alexandrium_andersonii.AAC.1
MARHEEAVVRRRATKLDIPRRTPNPREHVGGPDLRWETPRLNKGSPELLDPMLLVAAFQEALPDGDGLPTQGSDAPLPPGLPRRWKNTLPNRSPLTQSPI